MERTKRPAELILTGHPAGWQELHSEYSTLPIRHLGFVRPVLLRRLFLKTKALLFFSLYEGFGMPLLEAFDAGTPVVCAQLDRPARSGRRRRAELRPHRR